jgi:hypothetical protein
VRIAFAVRLAAVLVLALAAILLAADAAEYPGLSRAGLRALGQGALPLLVIGAVNLYALQAGRIARWCAAGANVLLLYVALTRVHRGAPPFFWMLVGVALVLVLSSASLLWASANRTSAS